MMRPFGMQADLLLIRSLHRNCDRNTETTFRISFFARKRQFCVKNSTIDLCWCFFVYYIEGSSGSVKTCLIFFLYFY